MHLPQQNQAPILATPKRKKESSPLGARLKQAFGGATGRDIGRKLGYSGTQMSSIIAGEAEMAFDKLIRVSELTQCSLHWLLTGEGAERSDKLGFLPKSHRRIVQELATGRSVDVEQLVRDLLTSALAAEGAELIGRFKDLDERQRVELRVLSELITDDGKARPPSSGSHEG
jgi:hypothetical protein